MSYNVILWAKLEDAPNSTECVWQLWVGSGFLITELIWANIGNKRNLYFNLRHILTFARRESYGKQNPPQQLSGISYFLWHHFDLRIRDTFSNLSNCWWWDIIINGNFQMDRQKRNKEKFSTIHYHLQLKCENFCIGCGISKQIIPNQGLLCVRTERKPNTHTSMHTQ